MRTARRFWGPGRVVESRVTETPWQGRRAGMVLVHVSVVNSTRKTARHAGCTRDGRGSWTEVAPASSPTGLDGRKRKSPRKRPKEQTRDKLTRARSAGALPEAIDRVVPRSSTRTTSARLGRSRRAKRRDVNKPRWVIDGCSTGGRGSTCQVAGLDEARNPLKRSTRPGKACD